MKKTLKWLMLDRGWQLGIAIGTSFPNAIAKSLKKLLPSRWTWMVGLTVGVALLWSLVGHLSPVSSATVTTHTVLSKPENVIWGELFKPTSKPILSLFCHSPKTFAIPEF